MCRLAPSRHSTCMKHTENTVGVRTLAFDEQSTSIDSGVRKAETPTDGNTHSDDSLGGSISVLAGHGREVSLRHADVIALRDELNWLDGIEHPWGPFPTYQRHLEYILSQYNAVPPQRYNVHASRMDTRKDSLI